LRLLLGGAGEVPTAAAAFLAPLPLCLALALRRQRRRGDPDSADSAVTTLVGVLLGLGVLFIVLAVSRALNGPAFRVGLAALAAAGLAALAVEWRRAPDRAALARAALAYLLIGAALAAGGALAVRRGQPYDWDLRHYHFYNPYALLSGAFE